MANTIDWGQGAVNNTNNWGKGKTNATNNWGAIYDSTAAGETNITGSGGVAPFTNTYSMSFDGVDEYFTAGNPASLQITGELSISFWFKSSSTSDQVVISKDTLGQRCFSIWNNEYGTGQNLKFTVFNSNSSTSVVSSTNLNDGNWHNIVCVFNPSTYLRLYVDGSLDAENTTSIPASIDNDTADFLIGGIISSGIPLYMFIGNVDEVAIWNTDQSANVSTIYNGGAPTDLTSLSPLSWWRMGDGDSWNGSIWTLTDNGSGGNDATSVNMEEADRLPISPNSYTQNSFSFDGVDEYLNVGTSSLGITGAITVSAWVKIPTTNTGGGGTNIQVIACEDTTSSGSRNWNLFWRGTGYNYFAWVIFHTNLSVSSITSTGVVPNDGQWHHLLGTYDGTTNANGIKLYIDGVLNAQGTATSTGVNNYANTETTIGALTGGGSWRFEGTIDEVAIWNSEQSANISTIFNNGVPQDISSLSPISHWRMGENATWNGSTWTLTDQGSGGNNATSVNMEEADKTGDQAYVL